MRGKRRSSGQSCWRPRRIWVNIHKTCKNRRFHYTLCMKRLFLLFSLLFLLFISVQTEVFAYSETLSTNFSNAGIDLTDLETKNSVSRYETARLLNTIDCKDCLAPNSWMENQYNQQFRRVFSNTPDFNFSDIVFWQAKRESKNYYYCVAYVADNEYMRWYPTTSTILNCKNKFCWTQNTTKSEFFQAILNIIDNQIFSSFSANRKDIKSWLSTLSPTSYQYQVLTSKDIQAIQKADDTTRPLATVDELWAYMRYCMFHLQTCWFQEIAGLKQWRRPVSELNILLKAGVISVSDTQNLYSDVSGREMLTILDYISQHFIKCSIDDDYDCDGIKNQLDNCPNTYNPNQYDLDGDGKWNVCDDDIDWDWTKNPVWITDDNDKIIISKRDSNWDSTPLWQNSDWFDFFINVDKIADKYPKNVSFKLLTNADLTNTQWSMWDGKTYSIASSSLIHRYSQPWTYIIRVIWTDKSGKKAEASTKIYLAPDTASQFSLTITPTFSIKTNGSQYSFKPDFAWTIDKIIRTVNDREIQSLSPSETFTYLLSTDWRYLIRAKAYSHDKLQAVAQSVVNHSSIPVFASVQILWANLQWKTRFSLNIIGQRTSNLQSVQRDFGDWTISTSTWTAIQHQYTTSGLKTVQQLISFTNWQKVQLISTIFITNPLSAISQSINITPDFLVNFYPTLSLNPINITKTTHSVVWKPWIQELRVQSTVNRCVSLFNRWQTVKSATDICLEAFKSWKLSQFKNDLDKDWIPDICDDDIDWDWVKNQLGLITKDNPDGSFTADNVDVSILKKHFWVCSLDNSPFTQNPKQEDINKNWIWDAGEILIQAIISKSSNVSQPSTSQSTPTPSASLNPQIWQDTVCDSPISPFCWNWKIDPDETCQTCPEDVWKCSSICWDGIADPGETCQNCPQDLPNCKPEDEEEKKCWNWIIDSGETCQSCPQDTGKCSGRCWNWVIDWDEQCDNPNNPLCVKCKLTTCWNWIIDAGENCQTCKIDMWNWCSNNNENECNNKCDKWDCEICPTDCSSEEKLVCDNTSKCWNWIIDQWETCQTCPEDVQRCATTCWNWRIDSGEQCDNWKLNWKDWKCSLTCQTVWWDIPWWDIPGWWDTKRNITPKECIACPCEFVDYAGDLMPWDSLKAKLRDSQYSAIYSFSPVFTVNFEF